MLGYLGVPHRVTASPKDIADADRIILPGVGAFDAGIEKLSQSGLAETLNHRVVRDEIPVLGICLGMQIMCASSEEGKLRGLNWFDAEVRRFAVDAATPPLPIPHMGWNDVEVCKMHPVLNSLCTGPMSPRFYFAHSYHVLCADPSDMLLRAQYGHPVAAAIARRNIVAVQFHPEKSHKFGMALLQAFAMWNYVSA